MKKLVLAFLFVSALSQAADGPAALRFTACGNPNTTEMLCTASTGNGNLYIVRSTQDKAPTFYRANRAVAQKDGNTVEEYTAFAISTDPANADNFVENTLKLVVTSTAEAQEAGAVLSSNGKSNAAKGYDKFKLTRITQ